MRKCRCTPLMTCGKHIANDPQPGLDSSCTVSREYITGAFHNRPTTHDTLKFGHPTFNCNICSSFTQRTSQLCLNHSQEPCEWVDADLGVLWIESEQILHLKVGCRNFGPVRDSAIYPNSTFVFKNTLKYYLIIDIVFIDFVLQKTNKLRITRLFMCVS